MEDGTCPNVTKNYTLDKNYVCIEYPGLVLNVDKALDTLGGIEEISSCHDRTNRRLELRFRKDIYAKPACADKTNTSDLLIKVNQVKKRSKLTGEVKTEYEVHVLAMCDFQYLPMVKTPEGDYESILPQLTTKDLVDRDYLDQPCPLFLTPPTFSRMDAPQDYHFRKEVRSDNQPSNFISRVRQRRSLHAIFLNFDDEFVPTKPREIAVKQLPVKLITQEQIDQVKQVFEMRSVWSKAALTAHLPPNFPQAKLKAILPIISFYFVTGPWRNSWVKLAFDPRQSPEARFWQTLDYRLRKAGGAYSKVEAKRSYAHYTMPYRTSNISKTRTSLINRKLLNQSGQGEEKDTPTSLTEEEASAKLEDSYLFRPGRIPPARQMFYQYCDLKVPEIEALLLQAPVSEICDERNGWFPPGTDEAVRAILTKCIREQSDKDDAGSGGEDEDDDDEGQPIGSDLNESSSEEEMEVSESLKFE